MSRDLERAMMDMLPKPFKPTSGLEPIPAEDAPCTSREHYPPSHMVIPHGMQHRHICPQCGMESISRATQVTL